MRLGELWRWALWSPRRLAVTVVVLVVLVVGAGWGVALLARSGTHQTAGAPAAPATPVPAPPTDTASPGPSPSRAVPAPIEVARMAVEAWADHGRSRDEWYRRVSMFATDPFGRALSSVLPDRVPAHRVTGNPVVVDPGGGGRTVIAVPTDAGDISVTLVQDAAGALWRVDNLLPGSQRRE